jgi:plasmid stabilization system protein ParE
LIAAADEAIEALREFPESAPAWRPGHPARKQRMRRFPYLVIYRVIDTDLEIIAFAHDKRRPGYWAERQ